MIPSTLRTRCADAACISSAVRPRSHTTSSAIAKSDASAGMFSPTLTPSPQSPVPPVPVPTSFPLTRIASEPAFVPHITTQSVMGLTWAAHAVRTVP